jgi:hypothetical protein
MSSSIILSDDAGRSDLAIAPPISQGTGLLFRLGYQAVDGIERDPCVLEISFGTGRVGLVEKLVDLLGIGLAPRIGIDLVLKGFLGGSELPGALAIGRVIAVFAALLGRLAHSKIRLVALYRWGRLGTRLRFSLLRHLDIACVAGARAAKRHSQNNRDNGRCFVQLPPPRMAGAKADQRTARGPAVGLLEPGAYFALLTMLLTVSSVALASWNFPSVQSASAWSRS